MILSAAIGTNADLFPSILAIYAKKGDRILDMTFGKGVFWKNVDSSRYLVKTNDLVTGADLHEDFRKLTSQSDGSYDLVVLDPPYAYSPKGTIKDSINKCYRVDDSVDISTMAKVRQLYEDGIREARRLLVPGGYLVCKTQDIVQAGKQWWMHPWVMAQEGFNCEDLFVLVQSTCPASDPKWKTQRHARKNHSFFVVLKKV
jgi:tRNA G10  N-methylase Trm11